MCKNKEGKEAFAVTQETKLEGAVVVVTEDMEVLTGLEEIQIHITIHIQIHIQILIEVHPGAGCV